MKTKLLLLVGAMLVTINASASCQDDLKTIFGGSYKGETYGGNTYQRRAKGNWKCRSMRPTINKGCWN